MTDGVNGDYSVKKGDTLYNITKQQLIKSGNLKPTNAQIAEAMRQLADKNNIKDGNNISVGQKLDVSGFKELDDSTLIAYIDNNQSKSGKTTYDVSRVSREEGGGTLTSQSLGEEGGGTLTSQSLGEEGGTETTMAVGEEGGGTLTSQSLSEEGGEGKTVTSANGETGVRILTEGNNLERWYKLQKAFLEKNTTADITEKIELEQEAKEDNELLLKQMKKTQKDIDKAKLEEKMAKMAAEIDDKTEVEQPTKEDEELLLNQMKETQAELDKLKSEEKD